MEEKADAVGRSVSLFGDIQPAGKAANIRRQGLVIPALVRVSAVFRLVVGGFPAQKKHKVGILLDRAGLAEVVKGGLGVGFLGLPVQLGQDDHGDLELHGQGLEASGDFGDFDLAVFLGAAGTRGEELEIIDDQDIDAELFFDPAGAGPKLADGEQAGFVKVQRKIGDLRGNAPKGGDLAFAELAATNLLRVEAGVGGKKAEHELLGGHFQGEESDIVAGTNKVVLLGIVPLAEHVAGHAEGEGGFSNAGTGGQDDHFPSLESCGELVEFIKAGGDPAVVPLAFDETFDEGDRFGRYLGGADDSFCFPSAPDFQDIPFGIVEDGLDLVGTFMGSDDDLGAGLLEFPEEAFVLHLFEVGFGGEDTDDARCEITDQGGSAGGVGQFAVGEPRQEGGWVDRLAGLAHFGDTAVDDLVGGVEEILLPHAFFPRQIDDLVGIGEHGPEKRTFGLEVVMGGKALDRDGGRAGPMDTGAGGLGFGNHSFKGLRTRGRGQSRGESCWGDLSAKDG